MTEESKILRKEERRLMLRKLWNSILIFLEYLVREPYYELKELLNTISRNEVSLMYSAFILFLYLYYQGVKGKVIYFLVFVIFSSWIYGIVKSGDWKKYHREKYF